MNIYKKHKTLLSLWESSFAAYNDLHEISSKLLKNREHSFNSPFSNEQIQHVIVGAGALLFSIIKERIIDKNGSNYSLLIDNEKFRSLTNNIIVNKKGKIYVDNVCFDNELVAFDFIRNKLLHGDYYIEDEYIFMEKDETEFRINFIDFISFVLNAYDYLVNGKKSFEKYFVLPKGMTYVYDIDTRLNSDMLDCIKVKISKSGKRLINEKDISMLDGLLQVIRINACVNNMNFRELLGYYESHRNFEVYRNYFTSNKINISFEYVDIKSLDNYSNISSSINDANKSMKDFEKGDILEHELAHVLPIIDNVLNLDSLNITTSAFKSLIQVLFHYMINDNKDMQMELAQSSLSLTLLDDVSIAAMFVCFYSEFHYGLDELYSDRRDTSLIDLLLSKKFDFSELGLDELDDENMIIEFKFNSFYDQAGRIRSDYERYNAAYLRIKEQYERSLKSPNIKPENSKNLKDNLEKSENLKNYFELLVTRLDEFDIARYERYLNIINHIRNAFSHGNVTLEPYTCGDTLFDRTISIKDIHHDEVTYEKELSCRKLMQLFTYQNNKKLSDYVYSITSLDNKLYFKREYVYIMHDRKNLLKPDKKEEWQKLVLNAIDNNDEDRLYYLDIAYEFAYSLLFSAYDPDDIDNILSKYIKDSIDYRIRFEDENNITHNAAVTYEAAYMVVSGLLLNYFWCYPNKKTYGLS